MKEQTNIIVKPSNTGISRIILNQPSTYNALSSNTLKSLIEFNDIQFNLRIYLIMYLSNNVTI